MMSLCVNGVVRMRRVHHRSPGCNRSAPSSAAMTPLHLARRETPGSGLCKRRHKGLPTNRGSHAAVAAAARGTPKARSSPSGMGTSW